MQLKDTLKQLLRDDEQAVSPVISVILMVAITVILAAVIATFVLGMGDNIQEQPPQASFVIQDHSDTWQTADGTGALNENIIKITHDGGDDIPLDQFRIELRDPDTGEELFTLDRENDFNWDNGGSSDGDVHLQHNGDEIDSASQYDERSMSSGDIGILKEGGGSVSIDGVMEPTDTVEVNLIHIETEGNLGKATIKVE